MMNLNKCSAILLPLVILAGVGKFYSRPVMAATTARNLTVSVAELGIGIVVVDQQSGAINYCADYIASAPVGHCAKLGHITPSSSLPTAPSGLSVVIPTSSNVASNGTEGASVYVINNQTGDIVQCNTVNGNGTPSGACVDLGVAPQ